MLYTTHTFPERSFRDRFGNVWVVALIVNRFRDNRQKHQHRRLNSYRGDYTTCLVAEQAHEVDLGNTKSSLMCTFVNFCCCSDGLTLWTRYMSTLALNPDYASVDSETIELTSLGLISYLLRSASAEDIS